MTLPGRDSIRKCILARFARRASLEQMFSELSFHLVAPVSWETVAQTLLHEFSLGSACLGTSVWDVWPSSFQLGPFAQQLSLKDLCSKISLLQLEDLSLGNFRSFRKLGLESDEENLELDNYSEELAMAAEVLQ